MEETLKEISYQEQFQYNSLCVQRIVHSNSSSCNKRNGNKVVVPLVTSIGGAFLILAVAAISFRIYNKRHHGTFCFLIGLIGS
ncbi:hypothetical protein MtrunA17_Chr2g0330701 [Medicago truncatula]|uniref:Transmembrane protein n=1 Tax=Medicago truncatula TaxID=3880 RepID=A0A396JDI9_MEDTR|nr:hypothetical protein MtrunA17_Chr2g0330701 [Medicago truncatula]